MSLIAESWQSLLAKRLPLFGHRNWIVVADAAYPAQANPGIETLLTDADQIDVVREVLEQVKRANHVRANVYLDSELDFVEESDAHGVLAHKSQLDALFVGSTVQPIPHEEIIAKLDASANLFRVLILKTRLTIPYTSVFLELDCGYWNDDAEAGLRNRITAAK